MFTHPGLMLELSKIRQAELIAEADRHRLLKLARAWRHACRASSVERRATVKVAADLTTVGPFAAAPVAALAATLTTCGRHVAGSAR